MSKGFLRMLMRGLLVGCLFVGALLIGMRLFNNAAVTSVTLAAVMPIRETLEDKAIAVGRIVPRKEVKVKSQVNGILEDVLVRPGVWVKKGDLLAKLRLLANPVDINMAQSELTKAKMELDRAEMEVNRRQRLHEQRYVSDAEFQDEQLRHQLAKEKFEAAKRDLELRLKGASRQVAQSTNEVLATVDGMVLERSVEVGDFVIKSNDLNEGTTIVSLADMNQLLFKGEVEEVAAGRLKQGMPLVVTIGALPEQGFEAELEYIAPKAKKTDQGRITFEIHAAMKPKHDVFVRAGYSAIAEIIFSRHANVLTIPESHLGFHGDQPYVKVQTGPRSTEERTVITGLSDGLKIEITSGLREEDQVISP